MQDMIDSTELRRTIGENVRRLRLDRKHTQTELAEMAGIKKVHVNRIENGKSSPSAEVLFALADALGVTADNLRQLSTVHA
jgi:transcriptional regulator with XRE-family HTH domain